MQIPSIVHQSWKTAEVPAEIYPHPWQQSWRECHPDWEYRLWTDADNEELVRTHYPEFLEGYLAFDAGIKRADFSRFLYMHRFGGIYADLDFICLRNFAPLLYDAQIVVGQLSKANCHYTLPNAFLASVPGLDFWLKLAADAMQAPSHEQGVEYHAGPFRLQWGVRKYQPGGLRLLDPHLVYPIDWIHYTDWEDGIHYRPELRELSWKMRSMPPDEIRGLFPQSFAVTTWNHNW